MLHWPRRLCSLEDSGLRLVVLMIEVEQPEGLSTQKLVLETARHNVITAYTAAVGMKLYVASLTLTLP
jgi:hypothetical protein